MAYEALVNAVNGLPDEKVNELIDYALFLKSNIISRFRILVGVGFFLFRLREISQICTRHSAVPYRKRSVPDRTGAAEGHDGALGDPVQRRMVCPGLLAYPSETGIL